MCRNWVETCWFFEAWLDAWVRIKETQIYAITQEITLYIFYKIDFTDDWTVQCEWDVRKNILLLFFFFYNVKYTNIYTRHRHSAEPCVKLRDIILN